MTKAPWKSKNLITRLRWWGFKFCGKGDQKNLASDVMCDAADRIEKLEAENAKLKNGMWGIIGLCKWGFNRTPSSCSEPEGYCHCMKAFNALDYDLFNAYPID